MDTSTLAAQASSYLTTIPGNPDLYQAMPKLMVFRQEAPSELMPTLYEPVVCLILQGEKETILGHTSYKLSAGTSLLISHEVPVSARITSASSSEPYLALVLAIDVPLLRSLYEELRDVAVEEPSAGPCSVAIDSCDPRLIDSLSRYLALADDPLEAKVMGPLVLKEIHFRLLMARFGGMLRELLRHDSHASNIAKAIARIRRDFRLSMAVPDIARDIGMSASSFHKHFKAITSVTPLQYQKELRLLEARRLLSIGGDPVSTVAYEVGYESPNQFSREYARKFGVSPSSLLR